MHFSPTWLQHVRGVANIEVRLFIDSRGPFKTITLHTTEPRHANAVRRTVADFGRGCHKHLGSLFHRCSRGPFKAITLHTIEPRHANAVRRAAADSGRHTRRTPIRPYIVLAITRGRRRVGLETCQNDAGSGLVTRSDNGCHSTCATRTEARYLKFGPVERRLRNA